MYIYAALWNHYRYSYWLTYIFRLQYVKYHNIISLLSTLGDSFKLLNLKLMKSKLIQTNEDKIPTIIVHNELKPKEMKGWRSYQGSY